MDVYRERICLLVSRRSLGESFPRGTDRGVAFHGITAGRWKKVKAKTRMEMGEGLARD